MGNGRSYTDIELSSPTNGELERKTEIRDLRIDKLNQRVTFVSILIPCLLCAILLFVYFDIRKQVASVQTTGVSEVDNLSKSMETRLTSLTVQNAKLEFSANQNLEAVKKLSAALDRGLINAEEAVNAVEGAKAEKEELDKAVAALTRRIAPMEKDLKSFSAAADRKLEKVSIAAAEEIEKLSNAATEMGSDVDRQITDLARTLELAGNRIIKIDKKMAALSKTAVNQKELESTLAREKRAYSKQITALESSLKEQELALTAIKGGLLDLERVSIKLQKEMLVKRKEASAPKLETPWAPSPSSSGPDAGIPPHKRRTVTKPKNRPVLPNETGANNIVEEELTE